MPSVIQHKQLPPTDIHAPFSWRVADADARLALTLLAEDVGKFVLQLDDSTSWRLISITPTVVWRQNITDGDVRLSNDRVASGIRTLTTVVSILNSVAPTPGQILVALSDTSAEWQTPNDPNKVSRGGDSMAGSLDMGDNKVTSTYVPVNPEDLTNVQFVQAAVTDGVAGVEVTSNKSTDINVDGASDIKYPSVKSVKTYVDTSLVGLLDDRGNWSAAGNVFPSSGGSGASGAILKGDLWYISVAGTLGGRPVGVGDNIRALVDSPGQTSTNWDVLGTGFGYTAEDVANKSTNVTTDGASDTKYPSVKSVKTYVDAHSVVRPVSSTDTAIVRWNGTAGDTLEDSGVFIDASNNLYGHGTLVVTDNNTSINLDVTMRGTIRETTNGSPIVVTIPDNTTTPLPVGFAMVWNQNGAGQITFTPAGGVTLRSPSAKNKTNVQYSTATLYKRGTNEWVLSGDIV